MFNQTLNEIAMIKMRLVTRMTLKISEEGRITDAIQTPNLFYLYNRFISKNQQHRSCGKIPKGAGISSNG